MGITQVMVDCERMKYPHTGLYHFCLQLSKALIETRQKHRLCFYVPPAAKNIFGSEQCYRKQTPLHKIYFPPIRDTGLWHCTYQSSDYFPFRTNAKKLLTLHDLNYLHDETKTAGKKSRFLQSLQRKIDAADAVVAISGYSLSDAKAHLNLDGKPTAVIYNGCTVADASLLTAPAFVPARPFLFSIGTITTKKNFHVLPRLLKKNDFDLVIAGITQSPAYKEKIEKEATKLGVRSRLHFTGPVSETDKQWYLKNCAAFVFPSLAEGFGLPVVEAMYFGKPLLLSAAASLPEIGGETACYFSGFDEEEMQSSLEACLHRYATDASLKDVLHERALSFSWREAALKYHAIYRELLSGKVNEQ